MKGPNLNSASPASTVNLILPGIILIQEKKKETFPYWIIQFDAIISIHKHFFKSPQYCVFALTQSQKIIRKFYNLAKLLCTEKGVIDLMQILLSHIAFIYFFYVTFSLPRTNFTFFLRIKIINKINFSFQGGNFAGGQNQSDLLSRFLLPFRRHFPSRV